MKTYMKLIRDKIPMMMKQSGIKFEARISDNDEFKVLLVEKMLEEVNEFIDDPSLDEAADIYEVFLTFIKNWGFELTDVIKQADTKREERGGFEERVVLLKTMSEANASSGGSKYSKKLFGASSHN